MSIASELVITELFPNPSGNEAELEWVEIHNVGEITIDLSGWSIRDTSGSITTYNLPPNEISANGYYLIWRPISKIVLNNDSDGIELIDPEGIVVSSTAFTNSKEDESWCIGTQGIWGWCVPSPGMLNSDPTIATPNPSSTPSPSPSSSPSPAPSTTTKPTLPTTNLQLNEISACGPTNEWIEFRVTNGEQYSTAGYYIKELGGARRSLLLEYPTGLHTLTWSSPILNNAGDALFLFSPDDVLVETVDIPRCTAGTTWARTLSGDWNVSEIPTLGEENIFSDEVSSQELEIDDLELNQNATVSGVQTSSPIQPNVAYPKQVTTLDSVVKPSDSNSTSQGRNWIFMSKNSVFSPSTTARFLFYSSMVVFGSSYSISVRRILDLVQ